ncbi:DEAD/DEAH box helicase [Klebsiella aerogenes]|uniref:DEAD/DEAH box helicase n=1 Tax=Klebsiella aerogenes TaxID=548 RepID=UPI00149524DE|nr:DEAD/DEAH box helicase [Klebsiella aerogenes]MBE0183855.1 DEAD/DEAH box helicase [Klebsiella aerogenes]MBE0250416.1 DEAD/DEAH box helicase [Klebsiella aerogenes]NPE19055.1 DEAD/DEAH box helicase [Klebsiella aerogenes]HCB5605740.1 DEAD/DEAH box helicase [Klebsiella aerogenes]
MNVQQLHYAPLLNQLHQRAVRSVVSQLALRSKSLSQYLESQYFQPPGLGGSLLADPVFESTFGWMPADETMEDLRDKLISSPLVDALSNAPVPFRHQLTAWRTILEDKQSLLVSSGTGSGKTECFMVPVLEDLIRQQNLTRQSLTGTQAIFLYPLNALINSQQERLREWTRGFKGKIRFALYNGETRHTKYEVQEDQLKVPEQALSREAIYEAPPSIMVTNTTMLEYMLIRRKDAPVIEKSQGMLKYIVLDEAHSYIGSQAAELALLLRRVMQAFNVGPGTDKPVQIIATSATIGEDSPEGNKELAKFVADLAGVTERDVKVVRGYRQIPPISESLIRHEYPTSLASLNSLSSQELYQQLCHYRVAQQLRQALTRPGRLAVRLSELLNVARRTWPDINHRELLQLLDLMAKSREGESKFSLAFTPLRMHGFIRTLAGLWACSNKQCAHKASELGESDWPFGQVWFEQRQYCDCGAPVFEILRCSGCGSAYLSAKEEVRGDGTSWLVAQPAAAEEDEFALDLDVYSEDEDNNELENNSQFDRLIASDGEKYIISLEEATAGKIDREAQKHYEINLLRPESRGEGRNNSFACVCCGDTQRKNNPLFRPLRLGAPFFLNEIIPTLLEFSPLPQTREEQLGPFNGRRLLTFTDSRQGTARISARLQQDADKATLRTLCYQELANINEPSVKLSPAHCALLESFITQFSIPPLKNSIDALRKAMVSNEKLSPADVQALRIIEPMVSSLSQEHAEAMQILLVNSGNQQKKTMSWQTLSEQLVGSVDLADRMRGSFKDLSGLELTKQQFADFCLYSEFGRRPKNAWTLESLGLVAIHYPFIDKVTTCPQDWKTLLPDPDKQLPEWRNLLKITLDFFIRENSAVFYENEEYPRWMGARFPVKMLQGPDKKYKGQKRDQLWPQIRDRHYNRVIKLLIAVFPAIQPEQAHWKALVNYLMNEVWEAIRPCLRQFESGYQLDIKQQAEFYSPKQVWRCPYTRRALDVTLLGYSPYLPGSKEIAPEKAVLIEMPELPARHWRLSGGGEMAREERLHWLECNERIQHAREEGVWSTRSDRLALKDSWYRLEEHSAQRTPEKNQFNEKQFKAGKVNVLNCSTTMEMGVDIGGMSLVAMNNVPPAPANYLQRAGRAGRRGESASAAITLCKNTAHGMEVFKDPLWAFNTVASAPRVRFGSSSIVQRHVNALVLGAFLRAEVPDATKLSCKWFFEGDESQCLRFLHWLNHQADQLADKLKRLTQGTVLMSLTPPQLLTRTQTMMQLVDTRWRSQLAILLENIEALKTDNSAWEETPAGKAITYQLRDYRGAYLFSKLISEAFLPGHGFPVGVVNFNYLTADELERRRAIKATQADPNEGGENFSRRIEKLPSRDLPTALREYAPGADVVLGGKVYRSSGIMLGKVLASGQELSGDHHIPWFWHCRKCGAGATSATRPVECCHCKADIQQLDVKRYLQPVGFATDIRYQAHNDVSMPAQLPWKDPRVLVPSSVWVSLPDAGLGRYRFSHSGELFHFSEGEFGHGYAICLSCGRAESQTQPQRTPENLKNPEKENTHYLLRGGSNDRQGNNKLCHGHVHKDLWLGYSSRTDMVELQLSDDSGLLIRDDVAARSLAVALREGLAHKLGIENTELGVTTQQARDIDGFTGYSIFIYDNNAGGAGYAVQLIDNWSDVFNYARKLLDCSCDKFCHHCLLSYDSQHYVGKLDRHQALTLLTNLRLQRLNLAPEYQYFGESSRVETNPLSLRIAQCLNSEVYDSCSLVLAGSQEQWSFAQWPLFKELLQFASSGGNVELLIATQLENLADSTRHQLSALAAIPGECLQVKSIDTAQLVQGNGHLLAQVTREGQTQQWAAANSASVSPGELWGQSSASPVVTIKGASRKTFSGQTLSAEDLLPALPAGAVRINLSQQLDGQVEGFGSRFWALIAQQHAGWKKVFTNGREITHVHYSDRYLNSPFTVRLLGEILTELVEQGLAERAELTVSVKKLEYSSRQHDSLYNAWLDEQDRQQVMTTLLEEGYLGPAWSGKISWLAGDNQNTDHGRELTVTFSDGSEHYVLLDMGLSYWRCTGDTFFDFSGRIPNQVERLATCRALVIAPDNGLKSYIIAG